MKLSEILFASSSHHDSVTTPESVPQLAHLAWGYFIHLDESYELNLFFFPIHLCLSESHSSLGRSRGWVPDRLWRVVYGLDFGQRRLFRDEECLHRGTNVVPL